MTIQQLVRAQIPEAPYQIGKTAMDRYEHLAINILHGDGPKLISREFASKLDPKRYDIITGYMKSGLAMASFLSRELGLGVSLAKPMAHLPIGFLGEFPHPSLQQVKDQRVLITISSLFDGWEGYDAVRGVVAHDGIPLTLAAVFDSDTLRRSLSLPLDYKEAMLVSYEEDKDRDRSLKPILEELEIISLVKESELFD